MSGLEAGAPGRVFRKAQRLHPGDRVAIVSQSWGGPSRYPDIYELGLRVLEKRFHLHPVEFPTARMSGAALSVDPKVRAADINAAFADRSIKGIVSSIGGDDSVRILPFLERGIITSNPKLIMGYSDFTTLLAFLSGQGNVTYHGPSIMAGIAQAEALGSEYMAHVESLLFSNPARHEYKAFPSFSHGYPDWSVRENLGKVEQSQPNPGWDWLQRAAARTGFIWGGCIEVLEFMKGTDYWPERSFFDQAFLLLETSEEMPSPLSVLRFLRNYGSQTILDRIQGLIFGRPRGYTQDQKKQLREAIHQVVVVEHRRNDIPILMDFDVGHTDPQFIVPFGVRTEIDSEKGLVALVEPPFDEA